MSVSIRNFKSKNKDSVFNEYVDCSRILYSICLQKKKNNINLYIYGYDTNQVVCILLSHTSIHSRGDDG